jgi:hypothetical protein
MNVDDEECPTHGHAKECLHGGSSNVLSDPLQSWLRETAGLDYGDDAVVVAKLTGLKELMHH